MKPPKCKSCGAEEWRHTCGPQPLSPSEWRATAKAIKPQPAPKPKTDRKEYLKHKARERRARQKAAKASA